MVYTDRVHLIAESIDELHAFAKGIGLHECWFHRGSRHPHYDLINKKLKPLYDKHGEKFMDKAIRLGALKVTDRQIIKISRSCYFLPTTEEEVEEFERRHNWELSQPLSKNDQETLDRIWENVKKKIFKNDS